MQLEGMEHVPAANGGDTRVVGLKSHASEERRCVAVEENENELEHARKDKTTHSTYSIQDPHAQEYGKKKKKRTRTHAQLNRATTKLRLSQRATRRTKTRERKRHE